MDEQAAVNEFITRSRVLCDTANRNHRKEAENYIQSIRSQHSDLTFSVCNVISLRSVQAAQLAPEDLLASQTMCWICKHKAISGSQMQALIDLMLQLAGKGYSVQHPITVQISAAVSSVLLINNLNIAVNTDGLSASWSASVVEGMFVLASQNNVDTQRWISYILSVLSTMPELVAAKEVISLVCANSEDSLQPIKALLVSKEVLRESLTVEHTASQAIAFATGAAQSASSELFNDAVRCCTLWVAFAAQVLQSRPALKTTPAQLEQYHASFVYALESANMWLESSVFGTVLRCLQGNPSVETAEVCMEMCAALCGCVGVDDSSSGTTSGSTGAHLVETQLCGLAYKLTTQLLPALSQLLTACCTELNSLWVCQNRDAEAMESLLERCLRVCRCSAESATALLPRAYKPLFMALEHSAEHAHLLAIWGEYLSAFETSIQIFAQCTHRLEAVTLPHLADEICAQRQQFLEIALSFFSDLAEVACKTTTSSAGKEPEQSAAVSASASTALQGTANRAIESVLVASIRAAAYSGRDITTSTSTSTSMRSTDTSSVNDAFEEYR